ncbi:MAG: pyridoxal phosphate-dependent aminotransferase, partial [Eubacteriales bacterium]|nr:pyridoxal phosphate-dependent aminotransferase [Eubacteriales bacterium]
MGENDMGIRISDKCRGISPSATLRLNALVGEMRAQGRDVISMAAGEPDMDTPERVKAAAVKALNEGKTKYTATAGILPLRQAIAQGLKDRYKLDYVPDEIMASGGAKQALLACLTAVLNPGDEVLLPTPCWLSYPELIRMADGVPVMVETNAAQGYVPAMDALEKKMSFRTRAILINSPSNPTGAVYDREQLVLIAAFAQEHDLVIISDEIYEDFVYGGASHIPIASLSRDARSRTVIINGFSKAYAMTGWRLGFAAGPKDVVAAMDAYQGHAAGNPNTLAQYAGLAALDDSQAARDIVAAFATRRESMLKALETVQGATFYPPQGAFYVLMDISGLIGKSYRGNVISDDTAFAELLLEHAGVSVVPGEPFFAPGTCRLSYAVSEERIEEAIRRLGAFMSK